MNKRDRKRLIKLAPDSMLDSEVERVKELLVWHKRCVVDDEGLLEELIKERINRRKREGG